MGKIKSKKIFNKNGIILVAVALSICLIGVGYAWWNKGMGIKAQIKTGNLDPVFFLENEAGAFRGGSLEFTLSEDGSVLHIGGEVYPDFNQDIPIKIVDEGSVPSVFKELDGDGGGISGLWADTQGYVGVKYMERDNSLGTFRLNIDAYINEPRGQCCIYNDDASDLEQQIRALEEEISRYDTTRTHSFGYKLYFEQDI